jgi:hypothetical protein
MVGASSLRMWLSKRFSRLLLCTVTAALLLAYCPAASPAEGMWPPYDLPEGVLQDMRRTGLGLTRDEIWNEEGTGVANAVVSVGATGTFVSPQGLILTNHHVAYGAVQRISTAAKNYIEEGYLAKAREEEVPAHGYNAYIFLGARDVTAEVLSAVDDSMSPLDRYNAIERKTKEVISEAESEGDVYCEVNAFYGGAKYMLDSYIRLRDVRVVYVPPRSIGEYGGDVDNWMWPRHTADFSFLRAYVGPDGSPADYSEENVPYRPGRYLRVSEDGLKEGDFGLIVGFPGRTARYLTSYGLAEHEDFLLPEQIRLYSEMIRILEEESAADPEVGVRVASRMKGINNWLKKNRGLLEGFTRFHLTQNQRDLEALVLRDPEATPAELDHRKHLLGSFRRVYEDETAYGRKDLLMNLMLGRGSMLGHALMIYRWSIEKAKPDMERDPDYMDREVVNLKRKIRLFEMGYHPEGDKALLRLFIREAMDLPQGQRMRFLDDLIGGRGGRGLDAFLEVFLGELYANTRLNDTGESLRMFDLSHQEILDEGDYFIALAARLYDEDEERLERDKVFKGSLNALTPEWTEIMAAGRNVVPYPDANGTMRINYGAVNGYSPRDAVHYGALTTLKGVAEKSTGIPPFDCPERLLELAASDYRGRYYAPALGDVPVNILTTHDSTNGNSGSPLINAKGEVAGCLFDGNYEALTSDFVFREDITRSIHVDARYILFIADEVHHADNLLEELGLK